MSYQPIPPPSTPLPPGCYFAAYNFGVSNVQTWGGLDVGTTHNDCSNDVMAQAQYLHDYSNDVTAQAQYLSS